MNANMEYHGIGCLLMVDLPPVYGQQSRIWTFSSPPFQPKVRTATTAFSRGRSFLPLDSLNLAFSPPSFGVLSDHQRGRYGNGPFVSLRMECVPFSYPFAHLCSHV